MRLTRTGLLLLLPAVVLYGVLLLLPLLTVIEESLRTYTPGRVGAAPDAPFTFQNYAELIAPAYLQYLWITFKLAAIISFIGTVIALPIAYFIARQCSRAVRHGFIMLLIAMMFLSALVRVYAIQLTMGSVGILAPLLRMIDVNMNSRAYIEWTVIAGMLHFIIPISVLTLIGTIQNINPRLVEAAKALGASGWQAHLTITVPLSAQGLVSVLLVSFTLGSSAFVVPWILGKGKVLFISNLIYSRFSEIANYPAGSAVAILMLVISLVIVTIAIHFGTRRGVIGSRA